MENWKFIENTIQCNTILYNTIQYNRQEHAGNPHQCELKQLDEVIQSFI